MRRKSAEDLFSRKKRFCFGIFYFYHVAMLRSPCGPVISQGLGLRLWTHAWFRLNSLHWTSWLTHPLNAVPDVLEYTKPQLLSHFNKLLARYSKADHSFFNEHRLSSGRKSPGYVVHAITSDLSSAVKRNGVWNRTLFFSSRVMFLAYFKADLLTFLIMIWRWGAGWMHAKQGSQLPVT